ncbi:MAG: NAD-dependent epimerase/dehydratase family protein, partial [Chloroflexota bacterium]|nr:NAD-dependent epimerase/dehydratase family protein [Chloroflexota bacterium]
ITVGTGAPHRPGTRTVLTVGTDCAVGKMSVTLELRAAAVRAGIDATFVATGQTGIMIEGWGITVDRVIGDFMAGATEAMVLHAGRDHDLVFVEGQGSLAHPAYSGVTLALLHGSRADSLVLCHDVSRERTDLWNSPIPSGPKLRDFVTLHERVAGLLHPSPVVAVAVNTSRLADADAARAIRDIEEATGLTSDDPIRFGADRLLAAVLTATPAA